VGNLPIYKPPVFDPVKMRAAQRTRFELLLESTRSRYANATGAERERLGKLLAGMEASQEG